MTSVDERRWVEYYVALEKPLYNVVYRWLWDGPESQDVVQEAFLRCWRARGRIRDDGFKAVLFRTALRLASNRRRSRTLWRMIGLGDVSEEQLAARQEECIPRPVREAIDALPETLKRVLLLCELAGLSYREIADVMEIKEGTVGSRRSRAIALLRQKLAANGVKWDAS